MTYRFTVVCDEADHDYLRQIGHGNASRGFRSLVASARVKDTPPFMTALDHLRAAAFILEQKQEPRA